tara:strand:+ start:3726 stop:4124 length:399 start_codon:yes stop_codon:yes gene_type:complete
MEKELKTYINGQEIIERPHMDWSVEYTQGWRYIVWVGGVDDYFSTYEEAKQHYDELKTYKLWKIIEKIPSPEFRRKISEYEWDHSWLNNFADYIEYENAELYEEAKDYADGMKSKKKGIIMDNVRTKRLERK